MCLEFSHTSQKSVFYSCHWSRWDSLFCLSQFTKTTSLLLAFSFCALICHPNSKTKYPGTLRSCRGVHKNRNYLTDTTVCSSCWSKLEHLALSYMNGLFWGAVPLTGLPFCPGRHLCWHELIAQIHNSQAVMLMMSLPKMGWACGFLQAWAGAESQTEILFLTEPFVKTSYMGLNWEPLERCRMEFIETALNVFLVSFLSTPFLAN